MKVTKLLCLLLALALALGGVALAEEAAVEIEPMEAAVPEVEAVLGEESPEENGEDRPMDAVAPDGQAPEATTAPEPTAPGPLTALRLPGELVVGVGEQARLNPEPEPADALYTLTYATSKAKVAPVDAATGLVTGKKKGSAVLTVTADNGVSAQVTVKVVKGPKKVALDAPGIVGVGDVFTCRVTYNAGTGGGWTLTSDNPAVLRVEPDNRVTALALGAANLTATSYNGKSGSAQVRVLAAPTAMWLDMTQADVGLGGTLQLTVGMPEGEGAALSFASSDANVATVDAATGLVTGAGLGEAVITARTANGLEDACAVRVLPAPTSLTVPSTSFVLGVGQQAQLVATPLPEGSACSLTYKSGKPKVASVTADGVVTGLKKGKAVITISTQNGVKVKVKAQVLAAPGSVSLALEKTSLAAGETTRAVVTLPKKTAAGLSYSVDNPEVARVSADGTVTALADGTANVIVTTFNGLTASALLTVGAPAPSPTPTDDPGEVSGPFEITFMNIGRNDGILIHCGGEWAFVDSGLHAQGEHAVAYMREQGVDKLKYYIGTHAHVDHVGGAPVIIASIPVGEVIVPHAGVADCIRKYAENDAEARATAAAKYRVVSFGEKFYVGGAQFEVLGPVSVVRANPKKKGENYNSLVTRVTYGANSFLLTGDAPVKEFEQIEAARPGCLRSQVYKNPHHDSRFAHPAELCMPQITVFCTRKGDVPKSGFQRFIRSLGSEIYITAENRHGHVKITSDGRTLTVTTQYPYPRPDSD